MDRRSMLCRSFGAIVLISVRRVAAAAEAQVTIDNFAFAPTPVTVKAGTTVTWVNHDDIPHSIVCPALQIKSHTLDTDESFAFRFDRTGTFDYLCGLHPHMHGQIIVEA